MAVSHTAVRLLGLAFLPFLTSWRQLVSGAVTLNQRLSWLVRATIFSLIHRTDQAQKNKPRNTMQGANSHLKITCDLPRYCELPTNEMFAGRLLSPAIQR